jgi:hypothetical protein
VIEGPQPLDASGVPHEQCALMEPHLAHHFTTDGSEMKDGVPLNLEVVRTCWGWISD